ncbi:MAG: DUF6291 domain-containing protein [Oscillospiraceae bacterium]|nr:DUF6291 domain-containing protein [Oscillospiraceae bacterium]
MQRPAIMLRFSLSPAIEKLSDADAGKLIKCALNYGEHGVIPDFSGTPLLDLVWTMLLPQLESDAARYEERCLKNRHSNYCKLARKSRETPLDFDEWLQTQPNGTVCNHSDGNNNSKDKGNQNSKNNESVSVIEDNPAAAPPPTHTQVFSPPTLSEVQEFISSEGLSVDAENFYNYHNSNGWKIGKNKMSDWRSACRRAEKWNDRGGGTQYTSGADRIAEMIKRGDFDD